MHTLAKNQHHNVRLIEYCLTKAYPDGIITVERLINDNLVNGTQVAELAISKTSGVAMCTQGVGRDLVDNTDVKTTTVYAHNTKSWEIKDKKRTGNFKAGIEHVARVTGINCKIGALRIIAYNPFFERWYFLIVPNSIYHGLYEVTLRFSKENGDIIGKYIPYEVPTWEELCRPIQFEIRKY